MSYAFRLAAWILLYAPSHRQDSTYHSPCYTSRVTLAGTKEGTGSKRHCCVKSLFRSRVLILFKIYPYTQFSFATSPVLIQQATSNASFYVQALTNHADTIFRGFSRAFSFDVFLRGTSPLLHGASSRAVPASRSREYLVTNLPYVLW